MLVRNFFILLFGLLGITLHELIFRKPGRSNGEMPAGSATTATCTYVTMKSNMSTDAFLYSEEAERTDRPEAEDAPRVDPEGAEGLDDSASDKVGLPLPSINLGKRSSSWHFLLVLNVLLRKCKGHDISNGT